MRTWIANWWHAFSTGFLFVPGLFLAAGIVIGIFGPELDRSWSGDTPAFLKITPTTARSTLAALSGAMFTITGVVFSTTCLALSITSAQLGPRLLRNFLRQQVTQVTIGICLATSACCLILLRRVDQSDGQIVVPHISILLASGLGVATLIMVVYFLHRVTRAMQAQSVASDIADDLDDSVQRLFPEQVGEPHNAEEVEREEAQVWRSAWDRFDQEPTASVTAATDGYLQAIDDDKLLQVARDLGEAVRVRPQAGDYLRKGDPLVDVLTDKELDDSLSKQVCRSFLTGERRTTQQDVECAINELVEIAVRALSPGVNDPFTAITCIDRLSGALCRMASRKTPQGKRTDSSGTACLIVRPRTFADAVNAMFNQLRQHSRGDVAVTIRLLEAAKSIATRITRESDREALKKQVQMIVDSARNSEITEIDLEDIERWYGGVAEVLKVERS